MKILKLFAVALVCVALLMTLIACSPEENTEGEGNDSFFENIWNGITGGDNNAATGGQTGGENGGESGSKEEPKEPVLDENDDVVVNDAYPDYGQEFEY